ncbi:hypothetical protein C8R45DRAFT_1213914 [Mycena sanguinolenta]|nr:hypothetical protein C8R45DRAFT_1213914 [Mycena sanguinolenta]
MPPSGEQSSQHYSIAVCVYGFCLETIPESEVHLPWLVMLFGLRDVLALIDKLVAWTIETGLVTSSASGIVS